MEEINPGAKKIIEPYAISQTKFEIEPVSLQPYKPGDKITRENFCNFLIFSFGLSRGKMEVQTLFMKWLKLHTGFEYSATLNNFIRVGGWHRLSEKEKNEFKERARIPGHTEGFEDDIINNEIGKLASHAMEVDTSITGEDKEGIENMKTFTEFSTFASQEVERLRKEKNEKIQSTKN